MIRQSSASLRAVLISLNLLIFSGSSVFGAATLDEGVSQIAQEITTGIGENSIKQIAVIDFTDLNGRTNSLGQYLAEALIYEIIRVKPGRFQVIERSKLDRVLREQKLSRSSLFDQESIATIRRLLGVDAIITGTIADLGSTVKVNGRAVSVETGSVFAVGAASIPKTEEIVKLIDTPGESAGHVSESSYQSTTISGVDRSPTGKVFENEFLRVIFKSISRSKDRLTVNVALRLENKTRESIYLGSRNDGSRMTIQGRWVEHKSVLINEHGDTASATKVVGVEAPDRDNSLTEEFSELSPGVEYPVSFLFQKIIKTFSSYKFMKIEGQKFSLNLQLLRLENGQPQVFTVIMNDLPIN